MPSTAGGLQVVSTSPSLAGSHDHAREEEAHKRARRLESGGTPNGREDVASPPSPTAQWHEGQGDEEVASPPTVRWEWTCEEEADYGGLREESPSRQAAGGGGWEGNDQGAGMDAAIMALISRMGLA